MQAAGWRLLAALSVGAGRHPLSPPGPGTPAVHIWAPLPTRATWLGGSPRSARQSSGQPGLPAFLVDTVKEAADELIPEEYEAGGQGRLQHAGGQALEEAPHALLAQNLLDAVAKARVHADLAGRREKVSLRAIGGLSHGGALCTPRVGPRPN